MIARSRRRRVDPGAWRSELRGDLDWIIHRAMDPVRRRRHETANGLAADNERHLRDEPVVARPPTLGHRAREFVKRNTRSVTATALAAVFLLAFSVGVGVPWRRAETNLNRAVEAEAAAQKEARTAGRVSRVMVDIFRVSDPSEARGSSITAREILARGVEKSGTGLTDEPLVQARLLMTMGDVHAGPGLHEDARRLLKQALETSERLRGPEDLSVAFAHEGLEDLARLQGDHDASRGHHETALAIDLRELGPESAEAARSMTGLGNAALKSGGLETARRRHEEALAIQRTDWLGMAGGRSARGEGWAALEATWDPCDQRLSSLRLTPS